MSNPVARGRSAGRDSPRRAKLGGRDPVFRPRVLDDVAPAVVVDGAPRAELAVACPFEQPVRRPRELLERQAVRRSRASCSRRRMIGFASFTISSRYTM